MIARLWCRLFGHNDVMVIDELTAPAYKMTEVARFHHRCTRCQRETPSERAR